MQIQTTYLRIATLLLLPLIILITISVISDTDEKWEMPEEMTRHVPERIPDSDLPDIDKIALDDIVESFHSIGPINSLLISQDGEMVTENYFGRMNARRPHNIKSASKSILSILTGIAIDKGYLESVDQTIEEFFPEYFNRNPDSLKASITISNLLTMRAGLRSTSRSNYGRWVTSRDWIHYALDQPMVGTPGEDRIYSTGTTHLLGVVLARASNMTLLEFANRYLFRPLNIRVQGWDRDPRGYYLGGNNMALLPEDLVKIGQLMMNVGVYNGEQIVSREWVRQSIKPVTGRGNRNNYGYLWFRRMAEEYHMVYAFGNGGQYLMIIPELEAVIVATTRNGASNTRSYRSQLIDALDREVIPWLEAAYIQKIRS